jgi:hypothetical protein
MPPKASAIASLLEEYEGPLTADFQRFYTLRLADTVVSREHQEVLDLIRWMPPGSAFQAAREAKGEDDRALQIFHWTIAEDLLTTLLVQTQVLIHAHSSKKVTFPPLPKNPRDTKTRRKGGDAAAMARQFLAAQG